MAVIPLERVADGSGILAPARRAFRLPPGWTVVDHPLDVLAGEAGGPGQVTGYLEFVASAAVTGTSLVLQSAGSPFPQFKQLTFDPVTTTDGSTVEIGRVSIDTPGTGTTVSYRVAAKINGDSTHILASLWRRLALALRPLSGATQFSGAAEDANASSTTRPFSLGALDSAVAGSIFSAGSGNVLLIKATGIAAPSAWQANHAYSLPGPGVACLLVTNGGNVYVLTAGGTSAMTGGPSGTSDAITDNGCTWAYVGTSPFTITWTCTISEVETF